MQELIVPNERGLENSISVEVPRDFSVLEFMSSGLQFEFCSLQQGIAWQYEIEIKKQSTWDESHLTQSSPTSKLVAECVNAPMLIRSTPVSAMPFTVDRFTPPDASSSTSGACSLR